MAAMNSGSDVGNRSSGAGGAARNPSSASTVIADGVKIKGEISGRAEIVIEGEVEGRLDVQAPVVIGPGGIVRGDVVAKAVRVGGRLVGNVKADERFELEPNGRIEGDVTAPRVVIAEGAFFKGKVEMTGSTSGHKGG